MYTKKLQLGLSNMHNMRDVLRPKREHELPIDKSLARSTCALFYEWRHSTTVDTPAPYTLKHYDITRKGREYRSAYLIYMSCATEYEAAMRLLGSWEHSLKLAKTKWFPAHLESWRAEMRLKEETIARKLLLSQIEDGDTKAAKALLLAGSKDAKAQEQSQGAGRPQQGRGKLAEAASELQDSVLDEMLGDIGVPQ